MVISFSEQHTASTVRVSLQHIIQIDLEMVPHSNQQWVIVPSTAFRLVEAMRYSTITNGVLDCQRFKILPVAVGSHTLELHYKSLLETEHSRNFVLYLQVTAS